MGGSHVRLGPWLTAPLDDVIGFMAHPLMQRLTDQLTPQGAESVAMSRAYLRKRTDPNNRLKEESTWRDFVFPDLVKTLGTEHREHLVGSRGMLRGMAGNPMCTVVTRSGKPMDLSSLLAGKL
jgi:hypothetical protein